MSNSEQSFPEGSAPPEAKQQVLDVLELFGNGDRGFVLDVVRRLKVTDVSILPNTHSLNREEAVVVCEIDVGKGASGMTFSAFAELNCWGRHAKHGWIPPWRSWCLFG